MLIRKVIACRLAEPKWLLSFRIKCSFSNLLADKIIEECKSPDHLREGEIRAYSFFLGGGGGVFMQLFCGHLNFR